MHTEDDYILDPCWTRQPDGSLRLREVSFIPNPKKGKTMDIEKKITITLSENDVKEIIAEYLTHKGYKMTSENVRLVVADRWVGYGMDEHREPYFKECTAVVKGE